MAQLGATSVFGPLAVTDNISENGQLLINKYLGINANAASATSASQVGQNNTADNANYRILLSHTADNTSNTGYVRKSGGLCFNPSTGLLSTVKIDVSGSAGADNTNFAVTDTATIAANGHGHAARFYSSNMADNSYTHILLGKGSSSKNSCYIGFKYAGSNSNDSYLTLGHYAADDQLIIKAGGNVGVGTTSPGKKFDVNGSARATDYYVGTAGAYMSYNSTNESIDFNFS